MKPSRKELLEVLQESHRHLLEHDREYHHITPQPLLDKIRELLEREGLLLPKERK